MNVEYDRLDVLGDDGYLQLKTVWGSDEAIIEAARMSSGKGFLGWGPTHAATCPSTIPHKYARQLEGTWVEHGPCNCTPKAGDEGLLAYLWRNQHTSPFEQCGLSIEVQAPIMVFREWHRHRTQSYNEFSARYAQMPNIHYIPDAGRVRKQSATNKQGTADEELAPEIVQEFLTRIEQEQAGVYATYQWAIDHGIAREIARINTPVSRYSRMVASANLLNWFRFLKLRTAENAQWEIRQYALALEEVVKDHFPRSFALYKEQS